jgi:hypothetical protein
MYSDYDVQIQTYYEPDLVNRKNNKNVSDYINIYKNTLSSPFNLFISLNG